MFNVGGESAVPVPACIFVVPILLLLLLLLWVDFYDLRQFSLLWNYRYINNPSGRRRRRQRPSSHTEPPFAIRRIRPTVRSSLVCIQGGFVVVRRRVFIPVPFRTPILESLIFEYCWRGGLRVLCWASNYAPLEFLEM